MPIIIKVEYLTIQRWNIFTFVISESRKTLIISTLADSKNLKKGREGTPSATGTIYILHPIFSNRTSGILQLGGDSQVSNTPKPPNHPSFRYIPVTSFAILIGVISAHRRSPKFSNPPYKTAQPTFPKFSPAPNFQTDFPSLLKFP